MLALIQEELSKRGTEDQALDLLDKLRDGYVLEDLKLYVDNILAIHNPNLLTGITSRLIVDHETGETVKEFRDKAITVIETETDLEHLYTWEGRSVYVKDTGLFVYQNGFKYQYDKYSAPSLYAKDIKTDGTDQLSKLNFYAQLAASQKIKLVLPAGTITLGDEFIPPNGLIMVGINEAASGGNSLNISGTILKWKSGVNGTNKAVIRCSTSAIGTTPINAISGVKLKGIAIDATGCDYGLYFRYFTNESSVDEIIVANANKCNIAGYQLWFSYFGKLISIGSKNVGIAFGYALGGETGDLAVNGIDFSYLRAHTSGQLGTYNKISGKYNGAGIIVNTQGCNYGNVQSELNGGIGIIELSSSRLNNWSNIYLEANAQTDTTAILKPSMYIYSVSGVRHVRINSVTLAYNQQIVNDAGGAVYIDNAQKVGGSFAALSGSGGGFKITGQAYPIAADLSVTDYQTLIKHRIIKLLELKNLNLRYTSQLPVTHFQTNTAIGYPFIVLVSRNSYSGGGSVSINIDGTTPVTIDLSTGVSAGQVITSRRPGLAKGLHTIAETAGCPSDFYCDVYVCYGLTDGGDITEQIDF
ncbi:hypothetical protein ABTJ70_14030 [Acinetobacter baumannii]